MLKTTKSGNPIHLVQYFSHRQLDEPRSRRLQSYLRVAAIFGYCIFAGVSLLLSHIRSDDIMVDRVGDQLISQHCLKQ